MTDDLTRAARQMIRGLYEATGDFDACACEAVRMATALPRYTIRRMAGEVGAEWQAEGRPRRAVRRGKGKK